MSASVFGRSLSGHGRLRCSEHPLRALTPSTDETPPFPRVRDFARAIRGPGWGYGHKPGAAHYLTSSRMDQNGMKKHSENCGCSASEKGNNMSGGQKPEQGKTSY